MALRVGHAEPRFEAPALDRDYPRLFGAEGGPGPELGVEGLGMGSPVRRALNNQLRTGTDKGNLTV